MCLDRARALCAKFDRASHFRAEEELQDDEDWSAYCAACPAELPLGLLATGAMSFAATLRPAHKAPWYFDNAASHNTTNDMSMLDNVIKIDPFLIGGIGLGCVATHLGELKLAFLPRPFGKCYFVPSMGVNLISLGYIHRCGGTYSSSPKLTLTVSTTPGMSVQSITGPNNLHKVPSAFLKLHDLSEPDVSPVVTQPP
jgi:hypothetical protein